MMIDERDMRSTIGAGLRRERIDFGLTPSQKAYCKGRAAGLGQLDAYRQAYPNDTSEPGTMSRNAYALDTDSRIVELVNEMQQATAKQSSLVPRVEEEHPYIHVDKNYVVQGIARLAQDTANKANVRLSAYVHLGKVNGVDAFRDIVVHEKRTRTVEEIDLEIARHLANMIDVTPNSSVNVNQVKTLDAAPVNNKPVDRRRKPVT